MNKEEQKEYQREYYKKNQVKKKNYMRNYRKNNKGCEVIDSIHSILCECGGNYTSANKTRHINSMKHQVYISVEEYNKILRPRLREYNHLKKQPPEEYQIEYYNLKKPHYIKCECGGNYTSANRASHFRTMKHQSYLLTCDILFVE